MLYLRFFLFYFLFFIFLCPLSAQAEVILNEVAIQPNQVVELYNYASESADISSWYIDDAGGTTYFTVPLQTILPPQSCIIFSADFNFNKSSPDTVRLFNSTSPPTSSSAQLMESYTYPKAPDATYSLSKTQNGGSEWRIFPSSLGLLNESLISCIPSPTPTSTPTDTPPPTPNLPTTTPEPEPSVTLIPTLIPTSLPVDYENIYISEVFPYPQTGSHEWIELFNDNNIQAILDHWYIDDGENIGSPPKSFSLIIEPYSYAVVELSSSLFNNNGDTVRLIDENKREKDSMEYGKINQEKSIGRISFQEDTYCEQEPSKNRANLLCIKEPTQSALSQTVSSKTTISTQKPVTPTKKLIVEQATQQINNKVSSTKTVYSAQKGDILGAQSNNVSTCPDPLSPIPYLSSVSFSYSLLTIASLFIKMRNA